MPKLHGFIEYRFVAHGWVHPDGYKVEVLSGTTSPTSIDAIAKRQEAFATAFEARADKCAALGHPTTGADPGVLACHLDLATGVQSCVQRARRCRDCTRTADRTVLVRVHIPVD